MLIKFLHPTCSFDPCLKWHLLQLSFDPSMVQTQHHFQISPWQRSPIQHLQKKVSSQSLPPKTHLSTASQKRCCGQCWRIHKESVLPWPPSSPTNSPRAVSLSRYVLSLDYKTFTSLLKIPSNFQGLQNHHNVDWGMAMLLVSSLQKQNLLTLVLTGSSVGMDQNCTPTLVDLSII